MPGLLLHSPADVVRQLLVDLGLGIDYADDRTDWALFASGEPDLPDNCITVYDTTGLDEGREMVSGERQEHHGLQIRVRSKTQAVGFAKARDISVALDEDVYQETVAVDGDSYLVWAVRRTGDPLFLGKDAPNSKRNLFTINATVSLRAVAPLSHAQLDEDGGGMLLETSGLLQLLEGED